MTAEKNETRKCTGCGGPLSPTALMAFSTLPADAKVYCQACASAKADEAYRAWREDRGRSKK